MNREGKSLSPSSRFLLHGYLRVALLHLRHPWAPATPLQSGLKGVRPQKKAQRLGIWLAAKVLRETDRQEEGRENCSWAVPCFEELLWGLF